MKFKSIGKLSQLIALLASVLLALPLTAQVDDSDEEVEEVVVAGSRIAVDTLDSAGNIVVYSAEDIAESGVLTVADFLRETTSNTLGSFNERSGSSAQSNAQVSLKGLGASRTLVLINGKRAIGSPAFGGSGANVNAIPTAAVARIEIIQDGAASIYGSDAIAGVINIVLKSGEVNNIAAELTLTSQEGGETESLSYVTGSETEGGFTTWGIEKQSREIVYDRDRDYSASSIVDTDGDGVWDIFGDDATRGYSSFGKNVQAEYAEVYRTFGTQNEVDLSGINASNLTQLAGVIDGCSYDSETGLFDCSAGDLSNANTSSKSSIGEWQGDPNCESYGEGFIFGYFVSDIYNQTFCSYDYTGIKATTAALDKVSFFLNHEKAINDKLTFKANSYFLQSDSFGIYAPPAAYWNNYPGRDANNPWSEEEIVQRIDTDWQVGYECDTYTDETNMTCATANVTYSFVDLDLESNSAANLFDATSWQTRYRWTEVGPRANIVTDTVLDATFQLDWDYSDMLQFNLYTHQSRYYSEDRGDYYLSDVGLEYIVANNISITSEEGKEAIRATTAVQNRMDHSEWGVGVNIDPGLTFDGGVAKFFAGFEFYKVNYLSNYDAQSEAGLVGGSSGNSAQGTRSVTAIFGEAYLPILTNLDLNFSFRNDDYSDVGAATSFKGSAKFRAIEGVTLTGSFNTGYRAPALDVLEAASTFSAESAVDYYACFTVAENSGQNIEDVSCRNYDLQYNTWISPNSDLKAETSQSTNFALNLDFDTILGKGGRLTFTHYSDAVNDLITYASVQDVFWAEWNNGDLLRTDGVFVSRDVTTDAGTNPCEDYSSWGRDYSTADHSDVTLGTEISARFICTTTVNVGSFSTTGISLNYEIDFSFGTAGDLSLAYNRNQVLSYDQEAYVDGPTQDTKGWSASPEFRDSLALTYNRDRLTVYFAQNTVGGFAHSTSVADATKGTLRPSDLKTSDWSLQDISVSYDFLQYGKARVFISNLGDKEPELDEYGEYPSEWYGIYNAYGRIITVGYSLDF